MKNKKGSKNTIKTPVILLVCIACILITAVVLANVFIDKPPKDDTGKLNKDTALLTLWEQPLLTVKMGENRITLKNTTDLFTLLESANWKISQMPAETGVPVITFTIEEGYTLVIYDNKTVRISYNDEVRVYKTENRIYENLVSFIESNTSISADDLTSLINQTKMVYLSAPFYDNSIESGSALAAALNTMIWEELDFYPTGSKADIKITAWEDLYVLLYAEKNVAALSFNGNIKYYKVPENLSADIESYTEKVLSPERLLIAEQLSTFAEIDIITPNKSYIISPDENFLSAIKINEWQRELSPLPLSATPAFNITDGKTLSIKLYSETHTIEINGGTEYYNIPVDIFVKLDEYLNQPPAGEEWDIILASILSSQKIKGMSEASSISITVNNALPKILNFSTWVAAEMPEGGLSNDPLFCNLYLEINANLKFYFYFNENMALIENNGKISSFSIPETVLMTALNNYISENIVFEKWNITPAELLVLIKSATNLKTSVHDGVFTLIGNGEYDSINKISLFISKLSLKEVTELPLLIPDKKIVLNFSGQNKININVHLTENGALILGVTANLDYLGMEINKYFSADNANYAGFLEAAESFISDMSDIIAARFCEALRMGDIENISKFIGVEGLEVFGYDKLSDVKYNFVSIEKADEKYTYILNCNVEDPNNSFFPKGESSYIVKINYSTSSETLRIESISEKRTYELFSKREDPAVKALNSFVAWCGDKPFNSPAEIDKNTLLEYCIVLLRKQQVEPKNSFTAEEINLAGKKYFGLDNMENTESYLYDKQTMLYNMSGKAAAYQNTQMVDYVKNGNIIEIALSWYNDPLKVSPIKTIYYTIEEISTQNQNETSNNDTDPSNTENNAEENKPPEDAQTSVYYKLIKAVAADDNLTEKEN